MDQGLFQTIAVAVAMLPALVQNSIYIVQRTQAKIANAKAKPGIKTTEMWLTVAMNVMSAVLAGAAKALLN